MKKNTIYVTMTDNFMSGWGEAEGKTAYYQVECDNVEQAEQIEAAAERRTDMEGINQRVTPRTESDTDQVTDIHYDDVGGMWIEKGGRLPS